MLGSVRRLRLMPMEYRLRIDQRDLFPVDSERRGDLPVAPTNSELDIFRFPFRVSNSEFEEGIDFVGGKTLS